MGKCITIITLTGAASLGLLTGSLSYQSVKAIPELIRQLNAQDSLKSASAESVFSRVKTNLTVSNVVNAVLGGLSTWCFATVYKYAPAAGKHPYLIYSAIGAPLALAVFWFQTGSKACGISGPLSSGESLETVIRGKVAKVSKQLRQKTQAEGKKNGKTSSASVKEEEVLDSSYIHVSEESLSGDSSPETPLEASDAGASSIEDEVDAALSKKEHVKDLETVASAYNVASIVCGVFLTLCSIGVIGDQLFL